MQEILTGFLRLLLLQLWHWRAGTLVPGTMNMESLTRYRAPEIMSEEPVDPLDKPPSVHATGAMDMWSVGVIAYELMTGKRGFQVTFEQETIRQLLQDGLPWKGIANTEEIRQLVVTCVDKVPETRPSSMTALSMWESQNTEKGGIAVAGVVEAL